MTLSEGFWMADTTVTQALWQAVMDDNPSHFKSATLPGENVNWQDSNAFIERLRRNGNMPVVLVVNPLLILTVS